MTATASFKWDRTFREGFELFAEQTQKGLHEFLELEVMRVLVETCYHWTAPPTKGNRGARGGRRGGQYIINRDVRWIVNEVSQSYLDILAKRFGSGPINNLFRRKDGTVYLIENTYVNEDGNHNDISEWHQSRRKGRGVVFTHAGSVDRNIGRWRPRDKMLVPNGAREGYIKTLHLRVGKLKAGWAPALKEVQSKLPAGWVKKAGAISGASGVAAGSYHNRLVGFHGYIDAVNDTSYFRDLDGFMARAHAYTENFFNGPRFERWLEQIITKNRATQLSRGAR